MNETVWIAIITGGCTLGAAAISGALVFRMAARKDEIRKLRGRLSSALHDLRSFQKLEIAYTEALADANVDSSANAAKLRIRKAVRDQGFASPSPESGVQRVASAITALGDI